MDKCWSASEFVHTDGAIGGRLGDGKVADILIRQR